MEGIIGSLWEYGALIVILVFALYKLWGRNCYLQDRLLELTKDYTEAMVELTSLIKGDHKDDSH